MNTEPRISIVLSIAQVNLVIDTLADALTYRKSAELIGTIRAQAIAATRAMSESVEDVRGAPADEPDDGVEDTPAAPEDELVLSPSEAPSDED